MRPCARSCSTLPMLTALQMDVAFRGVKRMQYVCVVDPLAHSIDPAEAERLVDGLRTTTCLADPWQPCDSPTNSSRSGRGVLHKPRTKGAG
jgi:hypothetical protein